MTQPTIQEQIEALSPAQLKMLLQSQLANLKNVATLITLTSTSLNKKGTRFVPELASLIGAMQQIAAGEHAPPMDIGLSFNSLNIQRQIENVDRAPITAENQPSRPIPTPVTEGNVVTLFPKRH